MQAPVAAHLQAEAAAPGDEREAADDLDHAEVDDASDVHDRPVAEVGRQPVGERAGLAGRERSAHLDRGRGRVHVGMDARSPARSSLDR